MAKVLSTPINSGELVWPNYPTCSKQGSQSVCGLYVLQVMHDSD